MAKVLKKTKAPIQVQFNIQSPETHRIQVTLTGALPQSIIFPVWTPGSYLVREYSRHITNVTGAKKINKNTWQRNSSKKITYEVYCHEATVRTSFLNHQYGVLVGATLLPLLNKNFSVEMLFPKHWNFLATSLAHKKIKNGHWILQANNDDEWIDSPILAASSPRFGNSFSFQSKNKDHRVSWVGVEPHWKQAEIREDLKKITEHTQKMFGGSPFRQYDFLLHFLPKHYGGLEHRTSQLSQFDPYQLSDKTGYSKLLTLLTHEYFHAWNIKSLRPIALGPFDYSQENYTEELWFAEGLTCYFEKEIPWKVKIKTNKSYWSDRLKESSFMADGLPSQQRRSVAESSFDAWIRFYRPDEDSPNTDVHYYIKGAQIAWCWDAYLQKKTAGKWRLSKLMGAFWREFGISASIPLQEASPGYTRQEILQFAEKVTGLPHRKINQWVTERKPAPWREAAAFFKVKFQKKIKSPHKHYLGMECSEKPNQVTIKVVFSHGTAESSGMSPGDELLVIDDRRVDSVDTLNRIIERNTKTTLTVTLARWGQIYTTKINIKAHKELGIEYTSA